MHNNTGADPRFSKRSWYSVTAQTSFFFGMEPKSWTGTGIFGVKEGRGRFLDGGWDQNGDHREGAKELFNCRLVAIAMLPYY